MNRLALCFLAATALVPAAAFAQDAGPTAAGRDAGRRRGCCKPSTAVTRAIPATIAGSSVAAMVPQLLVGAPASWSPTGPATAFTSRSRGHRWVRYYDDALLIDAYGRICDGALRHGLGRLCQGWTYDAHGIPIYRGRADRRLRPRSSPAPTIGRAAMPIPAPATLIQATARPIPAPATAYPGYSHGLSGSGYAYPAKQPMPATATA